MADACFAIVVFALFLYVALDGYDLGLGILTLVVPGARRRRRMVDLVATAWDGNESWLILSGVALFGGFPRMYAGLLTAEYLPLVVMLVALIFRGVAIEMIESAPGLRPAWGRAFGVGSLVAAFCQGVVLAAVARGLPFAPGGRYRGGSWSFLSWYSVLGGVAVIALYTLAGAAWVDYRLPGAPQERVRRLGRGLTAAAVVLVAGTAALLPVGAHGLNTSGVRVALLACCAVVGAVLLAYVGRGFGRETGWRAPVAVIAAEAVGVIGVVVLRTPDVAVHLSIAGSASPEGSLLFLVIGVGVTMPVVLGYNAFAFNVFRRGPKASAVLPAPAPLADLPTGAP